MLIHGLGSERFHGRSSGCSNKVIEMFDNQSIEYVLEAVRKCFQCGQNTPVVFTIDPYQECEVREPSVPSSKALNLRFSFWKLGMNQTQGKDVWANHCVHCGLIQGNGYIRQLFQDIISDSNNSLDNAQEKGTLIWHDSIEIQDVASFTSNGYCGFCAKKLQPIKNKRVNGGEGKDWKYRRFHVKCWKFLKDQEF